VCRPDLKPIGCAYIREMSYLKLKHILDAIKLLLVSVQAPASVLHIPKPVSHVRVSLYHSHNCLVALTPLPTHNPNTSQLPIPKPTYLAVNSSKVSSPCGSCGSFAPSRRSAEFVKAAVAGRIVSGVRATRTIAEGRARRAARRTSEGDMGGRLSGDVKVTWRWCRNY